MIEIILKDDERLDSAIRRFKKKVERAGIMADVKKHRFYEKPSEKKKRKAAEARRPRRPLRSRDE